MPALLDDVTGQRFGRWTVIRMVIGDGPAKWLCRCDCGRQAALSPHDVRRGKSRSCGCLQKEKASKSLKPLDGLRFNRLVVIARKGTKHGHAAWLCRCDCGSEVIVPGNHLRAGLTTSCGCFKRELVSLPPGEAAFNAIWYDITYSARRRGIEFSLSKVYFRQLLLKSCHYCGQEPSQGKGVAAWKQLNGNFLYNGIDRMDNSLGYTVDNVVPCCGVCNKAKLAMTVEEFREWVKRVYAHFCS